jgi:hypothetical protein
VLFQGTQLIAFTVADVKVSKKAESAGSAREKALVEAHQIAFQKLLQENFPDKIATLPPPDTLMDMVNDFSIDREKTSPTTYAASMTFQFDRPQVLAWVQQKPSPMTPSSPTPTKDPFKKEKPIQIAATYASHEEWKQIKKSLESFVGSDQVHILKYSSKNADLSIDYTGDSAQLERQLRSEGFTLAPQENGWIISYQKVPSMLKSSH